MRNRRCFYPIYFMVCYADWDLFMRYVSCSRSQTRRVALLRFAISHIRYVYRVGPRKVTDGNAVFTSQPIKWIFWNMKRFYIIVQYCKSCRDKHRSHKMRWPMIRFSGARYKANRGIMSEKKKHYVSTYACKVVVYTRQPADEGCKPRGGASRR